MFRPPTILAFAALLISLIALYRSGNVEHREVVTEDPIKEARSEEAHHEPIELAVHMGRIQRFHQKWWLAARAGNAELSAFYLHEMEEEMEAIADGEVIEDGIDVSAFMRIYGSPIVERLEKTLKEQGVKAMLAQGSVLVENCNACHASSGHPFIRIVEPTGAAFPDQVFGVQQ